jgi:hypothetical protein
VTNTLSSDNLLNSRGFSGAVHTEGQYRAMFRVSSLQRTETGAFKARKAIPADVRDDYQVLYGQRWEAIFTAPASTPAQRVKALHAAWLAEVERRIAALRAGRDSQRQVELIHSGRPIRWPRTGIGNSPLSTSTTPVRPSGGNVWQISCGDCSKMTQTTPTADWPSRPTRAGFWPTGA